jgi:hypothetical protein
MVSIPRVEGRGRGRMANRLTKAKVTSRKDMVEASHGFPIDWFSWPFMDAPAACRTPPARMKG